MYCNNSAKLQVAQEYCANNGWKVFPVHTIEENGKCSCGTDPCKDIGKHPITTSGVKDATNDPEKLKQYFDGEYAIANVGMACGDASKAAVLDVDGEAGQRRLRELEEVNGSLPTTVSQRTGSGVGRQYFFQFDERWANKKNSVKFETNLDTRVDGGYVILPPSKHKSGNQYEWIHSPKDTPLAIAPDWLLNLIPSRDEDRPKADPTIVTEPKSEPVKADPEPAKPSEPVSKVFKIERAKTLQERCVMYLEQTPPAISGQSGHGTTYNVCCRIVELFGELSDDDLFVSLEEWNQRCDPPWSDKELRRKITEARKKVDPVSGVREANPNNTDDPSEACDAHVTSPEVASDGFPTLSAAAYHGIAGEILKKLDPVTEADPASILMTFLTAFGVIVGRKPHLLVEGTEHHTNIYTVLVGQSSKARKGTSLGRVTELLKQASIKYLSGISTGEGLISEVKDAESQNKKGIEDKRRWIVESEFARCLMVMKREGNTLSSILRDAWDTGNMYVMTRNAPLTATNAHIGITSHITQEELLKTLGQTEMFNGFGNRFLWSYVRRSKCLPDGGSVDLSSLQKRLAEIVAKAKEIERLVRSPEAAELWRQVYPILGVEKCGIWDAVTSRAEAQVVRLSILYALLDGSSIIEVDHLKAALAVWDYCDESAKLLFDDPDSMDNKILNIVKASPGIKKSDVRLKFNHDGKTSGLFNASLASLVRRKEIITVPVMEGRQADLLYPAISGFQTPKSEQKAEPNPKAEPESANSSFQGSTEITPATISELFLWRNMNGVTFMRREGGEVWVTPQYEAKLTKEIEQAIRRNQSTVSAFVVETTITAPMPPNPDPVVSQQTPDLDPSDDEEVSDWSRQFLQELTEMESGKSR